VYLVAEYCDGPIYMGWHLYACTDPEETKANRHYEWLRKYAHGLEGARDGINEWCFAQGIPGPPDYLEYCDRLSHAFETWVGENYPAGFLAERDRFRRYRIIRLVQIEEHKQP